MKNKIYMRLTSMTAIILTALLTMTACSASTESSVTVETADTEIEEEVSADKEDALNDDTTLEEDTESIEEEAQEEAESVTEEEIISDDDYDRGSAVAAYQQALTQLCENLVFPDGVEAELDSAFYDISENQFAVCDVDMDGRDELILLYTTTVTTAGVRGCIYDYDEVTDTLYSELINNPRFRIYDNNVIEVDWSHSQRYGGDFWPYSLYVYDSESDTYQESVYTDAWDIKLAEVDNEGNAFPYEVDVDGDGIVYYILQASEYKYHDPIDWSEYEEWHNATVGNEIEVPYMELTPENIASIK